MPTAAYGTPVLTDRRLGKQAPRHDPRTLLFENYIHPEKALPPAPKAYKWDKHIAPNAWGMMKNDTVGDCTCAAAGHLILEWTTNVGGPFISSDDQIIAAYVAITGYNPVTGANDNGAVEIDVLNYWRQTGIAGHQIAAYVALEPGNHQHIEEATYLFGGCYIGLQLPLSAQQQAVWSVPPGGVQGSGAPGSWGGHAVPVVDYDARGLTVVTWGQTKRMTWSFWAAYCDEAYAILSPDFFNGSQVAPDGFDLTTLEQDLQQVTGTVAALKDIKRPTA